MPDAVPSISEYIFTLSLSLNRRVWMISKKLNILLICENGRQMFHYCIMRLPRKNVLFLWHFCKGMLHAQDVIIQAFSSVSLCCAFSPRDLPVFCEWRDGLRLWSRLVVTRGDGLRSAARMGETLKLQFLCYRAARTSSPPFIRSSFSSSTCCFSSFCHLVSLLEAVWHPRQ